ncbi:MAG TPA: DUF3866 family protein [Rubrobacteraceae bacterium]|nr:DUF3866 family protein [Rubrobacteraceae bacterium]
MEVQEDRFSYSIEILDGPLSGEVHRGVFYPEMGAAPGPGNEVIVNTVGLEMDLGTGGFAVILPSAGGEAPRNEDHFVKMPYTPLQYPVSPARQALTLEGVRVVVLPLHSHLAPACCAAADLRPGVRTAFVWQEGGALPVEFSRTARVLRDKGLLDIVISCGNCFGGDLESPNVYSGLLAAAAVADVVIVGIGPGLIGTGAPYGHGGMSSAIALNAALALGAEPVLAPRVSAADPRERHRGLSHHTTTVLRATLAPCRVALPSGTGISVAGLTDQHDCVEVAYTAAGLEERFGLTFESMGRSYEDDAGFFDAAAAAVSLALGKGVE